MNSMKILVAEDNLNHQKLAREALEDSGFSVVTVCDGVTALDAVRKEAFDVVVLDMRMPCMDGLAFINALRNEEAPYAATPIIVVSGYGLRQHRDLFSKAGIRHTLSKPYDCDVLVEKVKQYSH